MTTPVRLQLSRYKGFNLQEHSRAVNGLDAVNVARPGRWGNPFKFSDPGVSVARFRDCVERDGVRSSIAIELRGKNLACWCALDQPCHADILLELANKPIKTDE